MPFVGRSLSTGRRVDITKYQQPKEELKAGDIVCQSCAGPLIIKHGFIVRPHFAHRADCNGELLSHPESPEHLAGKDLIATLVKRDFPEYSHARVELEWPLAEVGRIADVAFLFPSGWIVAHEIQFASITAAELRNRTEDYLHAGVDVVWWLGKAADTKPNREWCVEHFGYVALLSFALVQQSLSRARGA